MKCLRYGMLLLFLCVAWQLHLPCLLGAELAAEESVGANPLTVDPDLAIFTAIVFVLLLFVLSRYAWRPLMAGLDQRERAIAETIDEAKRRNETAAERLRQYDQKLAEAAADAQQIVDKAKQDASAAAEELLHAAQQQAKQEYDRMLDDISLAKATAIQDIADQSADIAFTLASKLVQRELRPKDHAELVRETLQKLPSNN